MDTPVVLLCLVVLACTAVAYTALAAGGIIPTGTRTAGERGATVLALVVGLFAAVALGLALVDRGDQLDATTSALGWLVIACLLTVPAGWAFGTSVESVSQDASCGTISQPGTAADQPGPAQQALVDSCRSRLAKQKALVGVLLLPSLGAAAQGLRPLGRRSAPSPTT